MNSDGVVNISDVTALLNFLLGGTVAINEEAANMNEDAEVNITDVTMLISYVMSLPVE